MSVVDRVQSWRNWFPVPQSKGRPNLVRWLLLEGNRHAVSVALLLVVFAALMVIGTVWTFEMQRLLTETPAVQTILTTLLSGIILLVSIVVSINAIVLSHDITSIETQESRVQGIMEFRRELGALSDSGESPTDPASFLTLMAGVLDERARALAEVDNGEVDEEMAESVQKYVESVVDTIDTLGGSFRNVNGAEFGVLWVGLEMDDGMHLDHSRRIKTTYESHYSETFEDQLDDLMRALKLFTIGKEYFKTLYYTQEVSQLSRTLLVISLPAILINSSAILAINAQLFPEVWILGLPPLWSFVATVFTVSLAPYIVLTAYMLRLSTVARRTTSAGPFSLK